jgi:hypothetical protein
MILPEIDETLTFPVERLYIFLRLKPVDDSIVIAWLKVLAQKISCQRSMFCARSNEFESETPYCGVGDLGKSFQCSPLNALIGRSGEFE